MKHRLGICAVLATIVASSHAETHFNKTYLRTRPVMRNLAMQYATWHRRINTHKMPALGGSVQLTGFYQESDNRKGLGRYFGAHNPECGDCRTKCNGDCVKQSCGGACSICSGCADGTCTREPETRADCNGCPIDPCNGCDACDLDCSSCVFDTITVDNTTLISDANESARDLQSFDVLHNPWAARGEATTSNSDAVRAQFLAANIGGSVQLRPHTNAWGWRFDYYQDLEGFIKRSYLRISTGLAQIETCVRPRPCNVNKLARTTVNGEVDVSDIPGAASPISGNWIFDYDSNNGKTLVNYFSGDLGQFRNPLDLTSSATGSSNVCTLVQDKLNKLVIPCGCRSDTRLQDIEIMFGYNIMRDKHAHIGFNAAITIPTTNNAHSEVLLEPIAGNGDHFVIGAGMDADFHLWDNGIYHFQLLLALDYRFTFEASGRRVIGFKDSENNVVSHGWYRLFGKVGETNVFPGANVLCCRVDAQPGSMLEALAGLSFNWGGFNWDIGYNLYFQDKEKVRLQKCCWQDDTYGLIKSTYDPQGFENFTNGTLQGSVTLDDFQGEKAINLQDLCVGVAETPSQLTHKLYTGIGYAANHWTYPLLAGLGFSYEWVDSNSAVEQWAVWAKIGVSY